jgi:hypothetical protein
MALASPPLEVIATPNHDPAGRREDASATARGECQAVIVEAQRQALAVGWPLMLTLVETEGAGAACGRICGALGGTFTMVCWVTARRVHSSCGGDSRRSHR